MHLVFVYGTLRQGESNHHYLGNAQWLGQETLSAQFAMYDVGEYPAIVAGNQAIIGDVYRVSDVILAELDELEEVPFEYRREQVMTRLGLAWVYLYQNSDVLQVPIASGDWCTYRKQKK